MITESEILVNGRNIADIDEVLASKRTVIPTLEEALKLQHEKIVRKEDDAIEQREVTIMGDKEIPYSLLKKVMATCTQADYGKAVVSSVCKKSGELVAASSSP